jgi:transposase
MMNAYGYEKGKVNENLSWRVMRKRGFARPTKEQRKNIVDAFASIGKEIGKSGFDLIESIYSDAALDKTTLLEVIDQITLFELKTAGAKRKSKVGDDWKGLGFTLTQSEKLNAELLGKQYKFVFLNLKNDKMSLYNIEDFFKPEISNIYPTFSVFIKGVE